MAITYTDDIDSLSGKQLEGFFIGWRKHPNAETHFEILQNSHAVWLAFDQDQCVGFINALSDGILSAFIPLLEVLPNYQRQGIGSELLRRMMETLSGMYSIDIVCDQSVAPFYAKKGFSRCEGMAIRNYANQDA